MTPYRRQMYPANWRDLALACKIRANWKCEHCGVSQFDIRESRRGTPYFVYLAAAHRYPFQESNPNPELLCLCPSCHGKLDYQHKQSRERVKLECLKHLKALVTLGIVAIKAST